VVVLCYEVGGQNIGDHFPRVVLSTIFLLLHQELKPPLIPITIQNFLYLPFLLSIDDNWWWQRL